MKRRFKLIISADSTTGRELARVLKAMLRRYGLKCEEITEIAPNEGEQHGEGQGPRQAEGGRA